MNFEKIKEILKNKRNMTIAGTVAGVVVIAIAGSVLLHNKFNVENKVEDNTKVVAVNKESTEEKEVKEKLEELKKIDIAKLSEEDKKTLENKIADIEKLIENKEYAKATTDMESLKKDINSKIEEVAKEENKAEETSKEETKKEEVASNDTSSNSNSTSSNTSSNTSGNSGSTSSSNQGAVQKPTTPPVVEEKPVQPTPPTQNPQPPVVEEPKPVYPSVAEVKQRLIAYGQSLGLKYDPSINYDNADKGTGTDQMWGTGLGGNADCQTLFNGLVTAGCYAFNVEVVDLGNGFCSMKAYGIINWD